MIDKKHPGIGVMAGLREDGTTVDAVAEFGLDCCQVVCWDKRLCRMEIARDLKKRMSDKGVRATAMWSGYTGPIEWNFTRGPVTLGFVPSPYRQMRIEELKRWADFAVEMGAPAIITHCGFLPENMTDPEFEPVAVSIKVVADYCKSLGIGFWFETGQETPVTLLRFIEYIGNDNLGINLDPANLLLYGKGNPVDALSVFGKYVHAIHAKDGFPPTNPYQLGREAKVGEGDVRYSAFIPKLLSTWAGGDLTIEREIGGEQQKKDIRETIDYLKDLVAKAQ